MLRNLMYSPAKQRPFPINQVANVTNENIIYMINNNKLVIKYTDYFYF